MAEIVCAKTTNIINNDDENKRCARFLVGGPNHVFIINVDNFEGYLTQTELLGHSNGFQCIFNFYYTYENDNTHARSSLDIM